MEIDLFKEHPQRERTACWWSSINSSFYSMIRIQFMMHILMFGNAAALMFRISGECFDCMDAHYAVWFSVCVYA